MNILTKADVMGLSIAERIQLVSDIWDTVIEEPQKVTLSEEQKKEIDHRLDAYNQNPDNGTTWDVVRERIRSRRCDHG